jgi:hypothetical protein
MWNALTNSPTLSNATGTAGYVYRVSTGGTRNLGSGNITFDVGDYAIYSSINSAWEKADTTDAVSSVAGRTGDVTLSYVDLGASGTPSSSNFLRGDGSWAAVGGIARSVSTVTSNTTVGSTANTDYVVFANISGTGDPNYTDTTLLMLMNGSNNSTTFTDSRSSTRTLTANGNAKISTTQFKYGSSSGYFDGSGDFLSVSSTDTLNFGTGDFTVEAWIRPETTSRSQIMVGGTAAGSFGFRFGAQYANGSGGVGGLSITKMAQSDHETTTFAFSVNTWYHVAVVRQSGVIKFFIDGTLRTHTGSGANTNNWGSETNLRVGAGHSTDEQYQGYMDDVRVTKYARYTANFTAPTSQLPSEAGIAPIVTLPTAVSSSNQITIKNIHASESLGVATTSSQTIDGSSTITLATSSAAVRLISDGSNWRTV